MEIVIDLAIAFGAILAAAYCLLLSRRLRALTRLDGDVGTAIAVLSKQVDELTVALRAAEQSNVSAGTALDQQITQADAAARRLELLMAASQTKPRDTAVADPTHSRPRDTHQHGAELRRRVVRQREQKAVVR